MELSHVPEPIYIGASKSPHPHPSKSLTPSFVTMTDISMIVWVSAFWNLTSNLLYSGGARQSLLLSSFWNLLLDYKLNLLFFKIHLFWSILSFFFSLNFNSSLHLSLDLLQSLLTHLVNMWTFFFLYLFPYHCLTSSYIYLCSNIPSNSYL